MKAAKVLRYGVLPALAGLIVLAGSFALHENLEVSEIQQIALIAESESYASRSRLVRNVDTMLRALRDVQAYWAAYAHLPQDQWASDASIEMSHFQGIEFILWTESARQVRFVRNAAHPVFTYRPSDEEWQSYAALLRHAEQLSEDSMRGPLFTDDGAAYFEIFLVPSGPKDQGTLIARVRAQETFNDLLRDDSPGFSIRVEWRGSVIFERGDGDPSLPESWTRSGLIRNELGAIWEVTHVPTRELADQLRTPAIRLVRVAGVIIAALIALLLFETARAERRARAAERAEREIAELNRHLEEQVRERTRELAERSQDLVTITESVGHDLRNPLNSISANTQLLQQQFGEALGADGRLLLKQVSASVRGMTGILDRLLALSVVASGSFERQAINMRELAKEIFEDLERTDSSPPTRLVLGEVPEAFAEPLMVRTLLMNLFSNALKYSRERSQRLIEFSAERQDGEVVYCVGDNGIGFDAEVSDRLFRAFERLDTGDAEGLGLGLDIAARVVQRHRGRIFARSEPGQGARFYFTLGPDAHTD